MYQHLFFDLDHTLWDFEANAKETLQDIYFEYKLSEKGILNFDEFAQRYSYHNERLWDRYTKGFIKQEELKWKRMWLALLDYKIANEELSRNLSKTFLEILPTKTNLFAYTPQILNYLQGKGYQLHLITNGFEKIQHNKLSNTNLCGFFNKVITSEASNSIKPQKEIFEFALNAAKADVANSIMIGDNIDADIAGGKNAGLDTVYVNHINKNVLTEATHTVFHLKQLEEIF